MLGMVKRSEIWKHFSVVSKGKAECGYCQKRLSFSGGATSNLGRHMRTQHSDISTDCSSKKSVPPYKLVNLLEPSDNTDAPNTFNGNEMKKRSEVWKHFSVVSNGRAECSYCQKRLSFSGGATSNLGRHLRTQHDTISIVSNETTSHPLYEFVDVLELPESKHSPTNNNASSGDDIPKRSEIWKYFSLVSKGRAECRYCQKRLRFSGGTTDNLGRHIRTQHVSDVCSEGHNSKSVPAYEFVNVLETSDSKDSPNNNKFNSRKDIPNRSEIWKHFSVLPNGRAECVYCQKRLSFSGGGTGNLGKHMRLQHKGILVESDRATLVSPYDISAALELSDSDNGSSNNNVNNMPDNILSHTVSTSEETYPLKQVKFSTNEYKQASISYSKQVDEQLTKTIIKQYYPFKMVEDSNFKEFIQMLSPDYTLPTLRTISHFLVRSMFSEVKAKVKNMLEGVEAVCLTVDEWESKTQQSYIAITSHFLNNVGSKTALQSCLLGCIPYNSSQTSENIGASIRIEVGSWNLEEKVVCVVTNNALNVADAVRYNNWAHLPCMANTLNLALGKGISVIEKEIAKIRNIVSHFKHSSKATNLLSTMQRQLNLPEIRLKQDHVKRYKITYEMLSRTICIKDAVVAALAVDKPELNCITEREWKVLEGAVEVFKIFASVAEEISTEKHVPLSKIMLIINAIRTHLIKVAVKNAYDEVETIITILQNSISQYFKEIESNELVTTATILDPRFKRYGFASQTNFDRCVSSLKSKVKATSSPITSENIPQTQSEPSLLWEDFDISVQNIISDIDNSPASTNEVDKYLNEPLIKRTEDPLKWWDDRKNMYPRLYKMIHHLYCIVVTSVPCERVFSKAGLEMGERRSGLKPEKILECLFLNYNL